MGNKVTVSKSHIYFTLPLTSTLSLYTTSPNYPRLLPSEFYTNPFFFGRKYQDRPEDNTEERQERKTGARRHKGRDKHANKGMNSNKKDAKNRKKESREWCTVWHSKAFGTTGQASDRTTSTHTFSDWNSTLCLVPTNKKKHTKGISSFKISWIENTHMPLLTNTKLLSFSQPSVWKQEHSENSQCASVCFVICAGLFGYVCVCVDTRWRRCREHDVRLRVYRSYTEQIGKQRFFARGLCSCLYVQWRLVR